MISCLRKMDSETVNGTVQALRDEISSIQGEMDNLQSDWNELNLWVQNGVDLNAANERHAELSVKQDILSQRWRDVHDRLVAILDQI